MRGQFDTTLVSGLGRAGEVLERGLLSAIRRGSLGFEDLRRIALQAIGEIAAQMVRLALPQVGGGFGQSGGLLNLGALLGGLLGQPGRATGGLVSAGRGYLVGERGPELFVPASAGRVEANGQGGGRDLRVSIQLVAPRGSSAPESFQRSGRQVARAVRRALSEF